MKRMGLATACAMLVVLAGKASIATAAIVLFTAGADKSGTTDPVSVPAVSNPHIPPIDSGVVLTPAAPVLLNGLETGPLNGITYGPGAFGGSTGGSTGWVNVSFTTTVALSDFLFVEVANVGDTAFQSAVAIDNIRINGALYESFEGGIPAPFTLLGFGATSGSVPNLDPTDGSLFAFLDTTEDGTPLFDTIDGTNAASLRTPIIDLLAGDTLSFDIAFLTTDGTDTFHDYALAALGIPRVIGGGVPEPASCGILIGLAGLGMYRRIRRQRSGSNS